jgi:predicted nucleic acid-binding protein
MSADRYTFDTNILFYSLDHRSPGKHRLALQLVGNADPANCIVLSQALGELCNAAAKKRRDLLPVVERTVSATTRLFTTVTAAPEDFLEALTAHQQHGFQFWDAVLWATARRAGCKILLSEDLQDGRNLGGVLFRNPFTLSPAEITSLLT